MKYIPGILLASLLIFTTIPTSYAQGKKALTVTDLMKFRHIKTPLISRHGNWVAYTLKPDRGDPSVLVCSTDGKKEFTIPQGEKPVISNDGNWVAAVHTVSAEVRVITKPAKGGIGPKAGLALLNTSTGELSIYKNVRSFKFSENSEWLVYHAAKEDKEESDKKSEDEKKDSERKYGTDLYLILLADESYETIPFVTKYSIDSTSSYMAVDRADTSGADNGVYIVDFGGQVTNPSRVYGDSNVWVDYFTWNNRGGQLAFMAGMPDKKHKRNNAELFLWSPAEEKAEMILSDGDLPGDWKLYNKNRLRWTKDGKRLFLGVKPSSEIPKPDEEKKDSVSKVFDIEAILTDRTLDVWHWNDPYINPNQKNMWKRVKDRTYTGVYHLESGRFISLANEEMPKLRITNCPTTLLGYSNVPYARRMTWDGRIMDYFLVDLETGQRKLAVEEQEHSVSLSPDGKYLVYFRAGDWHLLETSNLNNPDMETLNPEAKNLNPEAKNLNPEAKNLNPEAKTLNPKAKNLNPKAKNLTAALDVPFSNEDWDYPADVPGYRIGGWMDGSGSVLIYDKFDIWQFPASGGNPICLTEGEGRKQKLQFRIRRLDTGKNYFETGETLLLTAYHDTKKYTAVYSIKAGIQGITRLAEEPEKYSLLSKAKDADKILITRESYTKYPDLWVTDMSFKKPRKLSDANPQIDEFAWGEAELVEWYSVDSTPIQGILIKPGNYKSGKKYPVLVYYYRFFTNRLYDFNKVVVNHRPCFPFYASNGYAVFLPDIRFDIGAPGHSAVKCLVSGVQKIIDMGIADPNAICLHGHSWSGYQTAFVITQTDMFACAIAGAPVSNMTSAYSGIRWETGLARQFQYEKSQSRIGASLWEARDKYIENSPVFFADRINTPLLIQFGDKDGAVPWQQGIELYLAMRRLEKDCVFLQYRGEPHHLKQYANKLDYTLKFKAYLDHYLKGEPAPEWIKSGVPYRGK